MLQHSLVMLQHYKYTWVHTLFSILFKTLCVLLLLTPLQTLEHFSYVYINLYKM